jgi:ABC-type oligopeptide transport system substrate-binding subunit
MALFDGLTEYHPRTLAPEPALALRWEPEAGATAWVYHLRDGARWSDGTACTARDFVESWRRALDPRTGCPYANLLYYVRNGRAINEGTAPVESLGVHALDPLTLRVEMAEPTVYFPLLTSFYIFRPIPAWAVARHGEDWSRPGTMVTNGAFTLEAHRPYDEICVRRSRTYWGREGVRLEEARFLPISDPAQNVNLYQAGEIDVTVGGVVPRTLLRELRRYSDFGADGRFITYSLNFNCTRPPFDRVAVRRALAGAIDRAPLAESYVRGDALTARSFVAPGIPGYRSPAWPGVGEAVRPPLPRRIVVRSMNREPDRTVAQVIQRNWSERLGITVEIESEESQTYLTRLRRHEYEAAVARWGGDYLDPTTFLNLYNGPNPQNYPGWDDREYRRFMARAAVQVDPARRRGLLAAAEHRLLDQLPVMPLFQTGLEYLKKPWVQGWEPNLQDHHPLKYVWIDRDWRA